MEVQFVVIWAKAQLEGIQRIQHIGVHDHERNVVLKKQG